MTVWVVYRWHWWHGFYLSQIVSTKQKGYDVIARKLGNGTVGKEVAKDLWEFRNGFFNRMRLEEWFVC